MRSTIPVLFLTLLLVTAGCGDEVEDTDSDVDEPPKEEAREEETEEAPEKQEEEAPEKQEEEAPEKQEEEAPEEQEEAAVPWLLPAEDLTGGPDEYAFAYEEAFVYPDEDGSGLEFSNKEELWDAVVDEIRDDVLSYGDTDPGEVWFADGDPEEIGPLPYLTFLLYDLIQPGYYGGLLDTTVETDEGEALTLSYLLVLAVDDGHGELIAVDDTMEFPTKETEQDEWLTETVGTLDAFGLDTLDALGYIDEPGDVDGALE